MRRAATAFLLSLPLLFFAAEATAAWRIGLVSGRTLEANSYRVEKGRIFLEYPVGEASFPLSEVSSVLPDDQEVEMFQEKGAPQTKKCPADEAVSGQPFGSPGAPDAGGGGPAPSCPLSPGTSAGQGQSGPAELTSEPMPERPGGTARPEQPAPGTRYDPEAEEVISGLDGADGARQAEFEKKMDELFKEDGDIRGN